MTIDLSLISKYRTELMGFSAIGILMCHACGNHVVLPSVIWQICSLGQVGVSIFFLLSGMGMYYSLSNMKPGGVFNWYKARYSKLLVPYLIMATPFFIWQSVLKEGGWVYFLMHISTLSFWTGGSGVWFIGAIIALYLIIPWWHRLLNDKDYAWVPTLLIFAVLISCGQWRHFEEQAFFFLGYWLGKPVSECKKIGLLPWVIIPIFLYVSCRLVPGLAWVPRSLLLVFPFLFVAAYCFDKASKTIKMPFLFMGRISLESYMANVMLPAVLACVPWVVNGVSINQGNRLLYLCVVVFGILLAYVVHKISTPIVNRMVSIINGQ